MSNQDILTKQDSLVLSDQRCSVSTEDSLSSHSLSNTFLTKKKQDIYLPQQNNSYIESKRLLMVPFICSLMFGSLFNLTFQTFIKEQLMSSMQMSNSMYQMFVLVPNLPNIFLPLIIGPVLDVIGARNGLVISTLLVAVGMFICYIAVQVQSFAIILSGKVLMSIAVDAQGIAHGCLLGKWYKDKGLATVFTLNSLVCKIASSSSGIVYPILFESSQGLTLPILVGSLTCIFSCFCSIIIFILDRLADKHSLNQSRLEGESNIQKHRFRFSDFRKFYGMFWIFALLSPITFGAFTAFQNYLQSVLTHKFLIDRTIAGQMLSIPYWIAFTVPLFGLFADKFGQRLVMMVFLTLLSFISIFMLFMIPSTEQITLVWVSLVIYGFYLSLLCAFLFPTIPLIVQKQLLSTGFGITHSTKSAFVSVLAYFGAILMKEDNSGSDAYLLTYSIIFFASFVVAIIAYIYDRKNGGIINSTTPVRFLEIKRESKSSIFFEKNTLQDTLIVSEIAQ